ncbi:MAG TPA: TlpA disulfide reductase family protein [Chloroflexota bacterium]|nr:TlpA disulfide reductase family protein [Chloroflexota bacterium]
MRPRLLLLLLPVALIIAAGAWWYSQRAPSAPEVGRPAPEFQLGSLAGPERSLADYRGHPIVLNFWATWCEPCKEEMPALQSAAASRKDLVILGIDNVEPAVRVKPFVEQYGITFPILLDQDGSVIEQYRIIGMPTSFFVDRAGVLRASYQGALTPDVLSQDLTAIGA